MPRTLTTKQVRFVEEYIKDPTPSRAATAAGYSNGAVVGARLARLPHVREAIAEGRKQSLDTLKIDGTFVLAKLVEILDMAMRGSVRVYDKTGKKPLLDDSGNPLLKPDLATAAKVLDQIARHKDVDCLASQRNEVKVDDPLLIQRIHAARLQIAEVAQPKRLTVIDTEFTEEIETTPEKETV